MLTVRCPATHALLIGGGQYQGWRQQHWLVSGNHHHSLPIVIQLIHRRSGHYHAQTNSKSHVVADMHEHTLRELVHS